MVFFPKWVKQVLVASVATGSFSLALADGVNMDWYRAFDHHPERDRAHISFLMDHHFRNEMTPTQDETLKPAVDAAFQAECPKEAGEIKDKCWDLVNFMLFPGTPMQTEFGRKLVDIYQNQNFGSEEGLAFQQAIGIDKQSLRQTYYFYQGFHDLYYLPFSRFYALEPSDEEFDSEVQEVLRGTEAKRLHSERYEAFKALALVHKRLAYSEASYSDYLLAYRRYFQAKYMHQSIENLAPKLRMLNDALLQLSQMRGASEEALDRQAEVYLVEKKRLISSAGWIRERLNAYFPIINKWLQFKAKRYEYTDLDLGELESLRRLDALGMLGHLTSQKKSAFGLLLLYEHGFQMLPLLPEELADYATKAKKLREEMKWENAGLGYLYNLIRQMDLEAHSPKASPQIPEKMMRSPLPKNTTSTNDSSKHL